MQLQKVINIEMTLDLRGNENIREMYRSCLDTLVWEDDIQSFGCDPKTPEQHQFVEYLQTDTNMLHHMGMVKRIFRENANNYYFPKEFITALSKLDRGIPLKYLPEKFWGYFEFGDNSLSDDCGPVTSAYIYIGKLKHHHSRYWKPNDVGDIVDPESHIISLSYVNADSSATKFMWPLDSVKMSDLFNQSNAVDIKRFTNENKFGIKMIPNDDVKAERLPIIVACLNAVLYITSEDPELLASIPEKQLKGKQKAEFRKKTNWRNMCSVPLVLVNHTYKEQFRKYSVDSAWWSPHLRWQPCGPNKSRVKLSWVKGHEKTFNKEQGND